MRIAFLSVFYPYRGGIAQFNERLVDELLKGNEVKCYNYSLQYPSILFPGKSQYINEGEKKWDVETIRSLNSINPFSWWKTASLIASFNPDLLIVRLWIPFLAPSSTSVIKKLKKANSNLHVVAILDNVIPHERRPLDKLWARKFLQSCDSFVLMSDSVAKELTGFIPNANYQLIEHPINDRFVNSINKQKSRVNLNIEESEKVVLFFGFIREYKGLDILIRAKALSKSKWKLLIVGECYGSFNSYNTLIIENKFEEEVLILNEYVSDEDLQIYFNSADLCVLPYKSATQSGIIPVALHFDLPVITSNVGGLAEYVEDGINGIILKENTPQELSKEIDLFFAEGKVEDLKRGIKKIKLKYSWKRFSDALTRIRG